MKKLNTIFKICFLLAALSCSKGDYEALSTESGSGGSMACFTVMGDYLYTVDLNTLKVFDIHQPSQPALIGSKYLGFNIETLFSNGENLFAGSSTGVYIIDVTNPSSPVIMSQYQHVQSCDPVIADTDYAYVTLNTSQTFCGNTVNELQVLNISNVSSPYLLKRYSMSAPMGLGKNDSVLFVCDGGIKVFNCNDPLNLFLMNNYYNFYATDLIVNDSVLITTGTEGLKQYLINGYDLSLLSSINVK